jgi:hypothetical protein
MLIRKEAAARHRQGAAQLPVASATVNTNGIPMVMFRFNISRPLHTHIARNDPAFKNDRSTSIAPIH